MNSQRPSYRRPPIFSIRRGTPCRSSGWPLQRPPGVKRVSEASAEITEQKSPQQMADRHELRAFGRLSATDHRAASKCRIWWRLAGVVARENFARAQIDPRPRHDCFKQRLHDFRRRQSARIRIKFPALLVANI